MGHVVVVGVYWDCVRLGCAFGWLCTMCCIVHLAALRLLLCAWLCCCAARSTSPCWHCWPFLQIAIALLTSLTSDSMCSVIALVMWNVSLHIFCVCLELAASVLIAVSVADSAWLRASCKAVRSYALAMTTRQLHIPIGMSAHATCTQSSQFFVLVW